MPPPGALAPLEGDRGLATIDLRPFGRPASAGQSCAFPPTPWRDEGRFASTRGDATR